MVWPRGPAVLRYAAMTAKAIETEFQHFFSGMSLMGWIGHFLAIAFFGVAVPLKQGFDFLDVTLLLAYACLPCLFAAPLVAESVASRKAQPPAEGYQAQVITPFLFAIAWNALILGSGFFTVNAANWHGRVILPPAAILISVLILSMAATLFASAVTGWLSLNVATASIAKAHSRRLFLLVLVLVLMWIRLAPESWKRVVGNRLIPGEISFVVLPLALLLTWLGLLIIRAGSRRRAEDAEGPLLKLD